MKKILIMKKSTISYHYTECTDNNLGMLFTFLRTDAYFAYQYFDWLNDESDDRISGDATRIFKENGNLVIRPIWYGWEEDDDTDQDENDKTVIKKSEFYKILKQWVFLCGDWKNFIKFSDQPDEILIEQIGDKFELKPTWYDKK